MTHALTPEIASQLAALALGHVAREYPSKLDHVMTGPEDVRGPRDLHPIFYGSFDWHSCVHGHWLLARILRLFPGAPGAAQVRALLDAQLTGEKVAAELAYLQRPSSRGFERPYGWAWLLMLAAELARHGTSTPACRTSPAITWASTGSRASPSSRWALADVHGGAQGAATLARAERPCAHGVATVSSTPGWLLQRLACGAGDGI